MKTGPKVVHVAGDRRGVPVRRAARVLLLAAALVSCVLAVAAKRHQLAAAMSRLGSGPVLLAGVFVLAGTVCMMLSWRALLADLGSALPAGPAARIFFLSQLGKYLPSSVWPVVAQIELGRDHQVPARRSATAAILVLAVSMAVSLVVAALTLPFATPGALRRYGWAFAVVPVLAVLLHPRVLTPLLARVFRLARRQPPEESLTLGGVARAAGFAAAAWTGYGLQVVVLVRAVGGTGPAASVGAVGAFALAWTVGFLVVVAPAGAGVREAVLVLALSPALPAASALLVALASRLLLTVADLLLAGVAVLVERRRRPALAP